MITLERIEELDNRMRRTVNHSGRLDSCDLCGAMLTAEEEAALLAAAKKCHRLEALVREAEEFLFITPDAGISPTWRKRASEEVGK